MFNSFLNHRRRAILAAVLYFPLAACTLATCTVACASVTTTIDFDTLPDGTDVQHGLIINDQYESLGVRISADNFNSRFSQLDLAVAFDTSLSATQDPDLESPFTGPPGLGPGNLAANTFLGNALIIQEFPNSRPRILDLFRDSLDGVIDNDDGDNPVTAPDDEGRRPAGTVTFDFLTPITAFGFDLIDIELSEAPLSFFAAFFSGDDPTPIETISFQEFRPGGGLDRGARFNGDNSANRIAPITVADLRNFTGNNAIEDFTRVVITFGGSGAIDNVTFSATPEATSVMTWMLLAASVCYPLKRTRR